MASRESLHVSEEAPPEFWEERRSPGANPLLPHQGTDLFRNRGAGGAGPGAAVGSYLGLDRPLTVRRPRPDKLRGAGTPEAAPASRRRLLWEIRDGYHCSICGTCLSFAELGRIADKAGIRFESGESEHGIHGYFVQIAAKPGRVAKLTHKVLERKYRSAVERFRRARSEAQVGELWSRALTDGDVPGPYWALMTHPRSTPALMMQAFGEVHMLSHLAGATNRADIRRLRVLEGERQELTGQLDAVRCRLSESEAGHRRLAERHEAEKRDLANRVQAAQAAEMRNEQLQSRLREFEDGETVRLLRTRNATLESERDEARHRLRNETQRRSTLEHELAALQAAHQQMRSTVRALHTECGALESMLGSGFDDASRGVPGGGRTVDLCGRRVAYVGGRAGIVGHFRALVERLNGHFIHHDGGIEDHEGQLGRILGQADIVLCPVDCVSHRACLRAKRFCKRAAKPFVPLRSAGLSSFVTGLRRATEFDHDPDRPGARWPR